MERLRTLIGKKIMNHHLSTDELFFQTECGKKISILSKELKGWVEFDFDLGLSPLLKKNIIRDIEFYDHQIIFYFEHNYASCFYVNGIKRVIGSQKSLDNLELLLQIETSDGRKKNIHYFRQGNTWRIANFRQTLDNIYLEFAKKHDIINHPSVRIKTLL